MADIFSRHGTVKLSLVELSCHVMSLIRLSMVTNLTLTALDFEEDGQFVN